MNRPTDGSDGSTNVTGNLAPVESTMSCRVIVNGVNASKNTLTIGPDGNAPDGGAGGCGPSLPPKKPATFVAPGGGTTITFDASSLAPSPKSTTSTARPLVFDPP